jgi:hypothetical protein
MEDSTGGAVKEDFRYVRLAIFQAASSYNVMEGVYDAELW